MAAYTDNHHSYHLSLSQGLSPGTQHHNQDVSISELVDHGSISFGRFGGESLAWEKWSVFSHNRCQEELEKFKAPGLVAQKKAFFEDYYQKIRAMKKMQAEQEIEKSNLSQESHTFTHVQTSDETIEPAEQNCSDSVQTLCSSDEQLFPNANANDNDINFSRDETETFSANFAEDEPVWNRSDYFINRDDIRISSATIVDEELHQIPYWENYNGDDIEISPPATVVNEEPTQNPNCDVIQETKTSLATIVDEKPGQNPDCDILIMDGSETSSAANVEKTFVKSSFQNRSKDIAVLSKSKATVTSSRDKTVLHYRSRKDDIIKPSEKQKGSLDKSRSQILGEKAYPKLTKTPKSDYVSSYRSSTNVRSSVTQSQISGIKDRPTSSHSVRSGLPKTYSSSVSVPKNRPTSSHGVRSGVPKANITSISVTKDKPMTPSLSVRHGVPKASFRSSSTTKDRPTSSHSNRPSVPKAGLNPVSVTMIRPSSSSGVRSSVQKANSSSISIRDRPTSSHGVKSGFPKANLYAPLFVKSGPVKASFSSSSVRTSVPEENLNSKGSINKIHDTSKPKTVSSSVDNLSSGRRSHVGFLGKSLETVPKRVLPEIQKPKIGLTSSPARIKSKQNPVNDSGVKNNTNTGGSKTKILAWQSADMTQARRELRPKTPGWR